MIDKNEVMEFLKSKGFQFDPGVTSWDVEVEVNKYVDIVELLIEFGAIKLNEGLKSEQEDE